MLFGEVFERFVKESPICVMARGLMERALAAPKLDRLFDDNAERQYTKKLLFSTTVDVMASVVCRVRRSVNAAYKAKQEQIGVSIRALYDKLECLEPGISAELVRHTAQQLEPIIRRLKGPLPPLLKGLTVKILDGNHLGKSQRRLKILRDVVAGPLPGQTLVVLEPETGLASGVVCGEDGHAQERALLDQIWPFVKEGDVWIADRNFCTTKFLFGLVARQSRFIIRQHGSTLRWRRQSRQRRVGRTATGVVYEQQLWLEDEDGTELVVRRVTVVLDKPTRDGEKIIHLLTNLPAKIRATKVATLYLQRWTIEGLFQNLTTLLRCEVNTLAYPKAALFGFCVALAASNVLATVKAAVRGAQRQARVDERLSDYYVAEELAGTYRGMMIALPEAAWQPLADLSERDFVSWLSGIARRVKLERYEKQVRGPKKPRPRRTRFAKAKHVATARLLAQAKSRT
jgi:hypothetical protein